MVTITKTDVHISTISNGDTIEHNGKMTTVNTNNIHYNSFVGITLFGDSYNLGTKPVKKINFNKV